MPGAYLVFEIKVSWDSRRHCNADVREECASHNREVRPKLVSKLVDSKLVQARLQASKLYRQHLRALELSSLRSCIVDRLRRRQGLLEGE